MKKNLFKGSLFTVGASLWWGVIGVIYFKFVSFASALELTIHRTIWTALLLIITTSYFSKWIEFKKVIDKKNNILILFITAVLISINWFTWLYAVKSNNLLDSALGYYIFPILSVFFGILFLNESHNKMKIVAIGLVIVSVIYLLIDLESVPWIGLVVAFTWSIYTLIRKKIQVSTDIGLFIESAFMTPFAIIAFYFISKNGNSYFGLDNISMSFWLFLAGANTLIPLGLYLYGSSLAGLGPSAMIFFLAPTGQFLLGFYYFDEPMHLNKLISFVIIWFAVAIYLRDLAKDK